MSFADDLPFQQPCIYLFLGECFIFQSLLHCNLIMVLKFSFVKLDIEIALIET